MARQLEVDLKEKIEIVNSDKVVTGYFYWNPSDSGIVKRYDEVMESLENMTVPEGNEKEVEAFLSLKIKESLDYLMDADASVVLFRTEPFTLLPDGRFYYEFIFEIIKDFIQKEMKVRLKKANSRIKKYTDKYKQ